MRNLPGLPTALPVPPAPDGNGGTGGMAPVVSSAVDSATDPTGQWIATVVTFLAAALALALVVRLCLRERITWPLAVLAGGTMTCLLEPMFDHLYGLWFPTQGQWTLFTTFGVSEPVWLPAAYLAVYGAGAVWCARMLDREPTMRTVWRLYVVMVVVAIVAEIGYVAGLGVYEYQDGQAFVVLGYPLFLGFVNSMSALLTGIVAHAMVPWLRGASVVMLATIPPMTFVLDAFGSGFLYLSLRHAAAPMPSWLLHVGALTVVAGSALTVRLLAMLMPAGRSAAASVSAVPERESVA